MSYQDLLADLLAHADTERALAMSAYMKNIFSFMGIATPVRRAVSKPYLTGMLKIKEVDYAFVDECWDCEYRELQYVAADYLLAAKFLSADDVPRIKECIIRKSWWDSVDGLDKVVGGIALKDASVKKTLLEWSIDDNIWLRRVAIDHQLSYKQETDTELLAQIIINNFGSEEFFVNKAIGWSLREYSKINPAWVSDFLEKYQDKMAKLSVREAGKHL